ncbi:virulence-associated E family protein [Caballeronia udeis]|uniref:Virulence-associated E family protein n=1 Tax=Caballeronia udeis TaxID=1232866 RepID=A0A158ERT4_9BURK|nr:toprim domain-containing protein [Caballeronia udeis]SAL09370.1 virulence-associated E family protein [Caballeronia udeis]
MTFERALIDHGLLPRRIEADGKWYRCPTADKPKKRNGAYLLWIGGQRGFFKNFATDGEYCEWRSDMPVSLSDQRQMDERIRALRAKEAQDRIRAIATMRAHWASLTPLYDWHPYLERKGLSLVGCNGLRVDGDDMVIPMYRAGGLVSLQHITMEGDKKYRRGCPVSGATFVMSRNKSAITCFVEGFATGLAVFQAVPTASVVVCFDANNLVAVAKEAKVRGLAVVCADNDWETQRAGGVNKGIECGKRAADQMRCGLAYPDGITGSDWADALHEWGDRGLVRVRMQIMKGAKLVV